MTDPPAENALLQDDSGLMTEPEFARALGCTAQTVSNRARCGDITPAHTEKRAGKAFRSYRRVQLEEAKKNWGTSSKGGTRPGAGAKRRRARRPDDRLPGNEIEAATLAAEINARTEPPSEALALHELLYCTRGEAACIFSFWGDDPARLSPARMSLLKNFEEIRARRIATDERLGRLVPAEEIEHAWGEQLRSVHGALAGVPARVAAELARLAGPDDTEKQQIRDLLLAVETDTDTIEAVMRLLAPTDINPAARELVARQIADATAGLSGPPVKHGQRTSAA